MLLHEAALTTQQVRVLLFGFGIGHAPEPGVPANYRAVLTQTVVVQVRPHAEQVQLHPPPLSPRGLQSGMAAQPQGAGRRDGLGDHRPLRHQSAIHLEHSHPMRNCRCEEDTPPQTGGNRTLPAQIGRLTDS